MIDTLEGYEVKRRVVTEVDEVSILFLYFKGTQLLHILTQYFNGLLTIVNITKGMRYSKNSFLCDKCTLVSLIVDGMT